jgi:hypothetical protein
MLQMMHYLVGDSRDIILEMARLVSDFFAAGGNRGLAYTGDSVGGDAADGASRRLFTVLALPPDPPMFFSVFPFLAPLPALSPDDLNKGRNKLNKNFFI